MLGIEFEHDLTDLGGENHANRTRLCSQSASQQQTRQQQDFDHAGDSNKSGWLEDLLVLGYVAIADLDDFINHIADAGRSLGQVEVA